MADDKGSVVETPPAKGAEGADAGKEQTPKSSGNAWQDVLDNDVPTIRDATLGELSPHPETTEKGEKPAEGEKGKPAPKGKAAPAGKAAAKPGEKEAEEFETEEGEGEEGKGKAEGEEEGEQPEKGVSRYSVLAEGGDEFEFEALPKGAKIVFKAAKQTVEVTSMDELVAMAQQGATLRQVESTYHRKLADQGKTIKALSGRLSAADKAFEKLLESDEELEKFRARATKLKDPEYRAGKEAERKLAQKEEQDEAASEQAMETMADEFWVEALTHARGLQEKYPLLEITEDPKAGDFPDVVRDFWGAFVAHRNELVQQALEAEGVDELTPEQLAAVDEDAVAYLTEENFEAVMQSIHAKIERRAGRTGGNGKPRKIAATQEEADKAEADAHNKHVDDKLRQRDTRTLRGKGAPPGQAGDKKPRPGTWDDHMAGIHEEFDKAKQSPVAD